MLYALKCSQNFLTLIQFGSELQLRVLQLVIMGQYICNLFDP